MDAVVTINESDYKLFLANGMCWQQPAGLIQSFEFCCCESSLFKIIMFTGSLMYLSSLNSVEFLLLNGPMACTTRSQNGQSRE